MNEKQAEELLNLQRAILKEQKATRQSTGLGFGCLIIFLIGFTLLALASGI